MESERISLRVFAGLILAIGVAVLVWVGIHSPQNSNLFPKCAFLQLSGYYCPGCGGTRCIHSLLNFEVLTALKQNLIVTIIGVPLFLLFAISLARLAVLGKWKSPSVGGPKAGWVLVIVILVFWVLRNIPHPAFEFLRPSETTLNQLEQIQPS